ncbi:MAG: hypothetical protein GWQ08_07895 [Verrucomicrobiaceae bacterium]|nr:hypothetical protein [Verrucomicrobiaceae bacterium]
MRAATFILLSLLALVTTPTTKAHPHNVSIGTAEWIEETHSFEVSIKLSVEDLEEILIKQTKQKDLILDGKSKPAEALVKTYVLAHLSITKPDGTMVPAKWIGYEIDDATAWLYIEFPLGTPKLKGHVLQNNLLIDAFEQQVNMINVTKGKRRKTLKFRKRDRTQKLPIW